ncbi:MAG: zinc-dependent metalloprotease [Bacteroidota bacterium]
MKLRLAAFLLIIFNWSCQSTQIAQNPVSTNPTITAPPVKEDPIQEKVKDMTAFEGYFDFWWDEKSGQIWLEVDRIDQEFLYVHSLPAGVGSNDIGLDRGQLGGEKVVKFMRSGNKLLLIQPNYGFRAVSDNEEEQKSVEEAFAQSVIWGFKIEAAVDNRLLVDATAFLMRDAHQVANRLESRKQGSYKRDASRSAIYMARTKNFPDNSEFEALLTFVGRPKGGYIRQVTPSPMAVSVRQHHSFVRLPDDQYQARVLDPRSGYFGISYQDYATPIDQPLIKRFINRHRLKKKDPSAAVSEAVEPIIYYLDRGAPEPVRSALLDGARWWNQAFEAAGYKDAFQVKLLPEGVDPLDVRYNVIQWVHRATRGWSYGSSVQDPRTGEIIKGHVSLGSLRVRQDYLIAQGLIAPYEEGKPASEEMIKMALARLRQLSAHEVGHTLGLVHNFAASADGRASVMDYPHPYITIDEDGQLDFSQAYDDKIGAWDKRAILYGYQDFPGGTDEAAALDAIIQQSIGMGLRFISDRDARPLGGAHPYAHLWDNGLDAIEEMDRLLALRADALERFGLNSIREGRPLATLEEVLVPLYLAHRYQTEAVVKWIGGLAYTYSVRGDGQRPVMMIPAADQIRALDALLRTLDPKQLRLPERILNLIPPKPPAFYRGRESFKSRTGLSFDPIAIAESASQNTISMLLHPERAARLVEQNARDAQLPGLGKVIDRLFNTTWKRPKGKDLEVAIGQMIDQLVLEALLHLAAHDKSSVAVKAISRYKIEQFAVWLKQQQAMRLSDIQKAHISYALQNIKRFQENPNEWKKSGTLDLPAGSPIGLVGACSHD